MLISVGYTIAEIDDIDDTRKLNMLNWSTKPNPSGLIYAQAWDISTGIKRTIYMHRLVMEQVLI